uniref:CRAL-TRIO domain-containing protein n=1 Tax=Anopheles epiroticus TaxID=199890 RepID=A0A182PGB9_9DIPT
MPDLRPLTAPLAKKAADELFEKPDRLEEDLAALRAWLAKCPHIKSRTDDQFLTMFLRGSKHSLERAKEKLDMYYTVRTALPELVRNRDPEEPKLLELIKLGVAVPLPNTVTPDGPRIILVRPGVYDPSKYTIQEVFRYNTMMTDIMMKEDDNLIVAGQMGILDLSNCTMAHFLQFSPTFVKKATMWSQEGSPLRQKGFHYVNTPSGFEVVYNMFKSFLNEKNRSRLFVHGSNLESLYEHIPKSMLPKEYGGDAGPIQDIVNAWAKKIISYKEYFKEEDQYGTDEKKRPGRPKNADSLFGLEGSFRKLEPCRMVNLRPISAALHEKAKRELNERPERIEEDLAALRQWLARTPHIRARIDDQFLVTFLRGCKYSLERAKEKIDMFYSVRTAIPELMRNRDPNRERVREIVRLGVGLPLPLTDGPDAPRIMLIRPGVYDPKRYTIEEVIKVSTMINDIVMLEDDNMVIAGQVGILDLANVTSAHFLQFSPTFVKKMTMMSQEGSPLRQKGFHYINTPTGFETVFNMFKSFMSEKNRSRLYVHGSNLEKLYEHIPKRLLPKEYGGESDSLKDITANWEKKILSYREYFLEEDQYGTDERKRVGKPKTADSLFGMEGSFRKLEVD